MTAAAVSERLGTASGGGTAGGIGAAGGIGSPHPRGAVVLERMRRRHLRAVLRIEQQVPHRGWSTGLWLGELSRPQDRLYVVARIDGSVVGFGGVMQVDEDAHVTTLSVDAARQGERIGTRLMLVLARQAFAWGCEHLTLEVRAGNEPAIALYRRFGLAPAGVRKNYYADLGEDALVMWAHDIATRDHADRLDAIQLDLAGTVASEGVPW